MTARIACPFIRCTATAPTERQLLEHFFGAHPGRIVHHKVTRLRCTCCNRDWPSAAALGGHIGRRPKKPRPRPRAQGPRPPEPRYPLEPLADVLGLTVPQLLTRLGIKGSEAAGHRTRGITLRVADRLTTALGVHLEQAWPELSDENQRKARRRASQNAYAARRRQDPEYRQAHLDYLAEYRKTSRPAERARNRRYYEANRTELLEKQAARDRARRRIA